MQKIYHASVGVNLNMSFLTAVVVGKMCLNIIYVAWSCVNKILRK